jgi:hypothetical protein
MEKKNICKTIKKLNKVVNLIGTKKLNNNEPKKRKHYPLTQDRQFKDENNHSFSLSKKTQNEHKTYILQKIDEIIGTIKTNHMCYLYDYYIKNITENHKNSSKENMYELAYALNIVPSFAFYKQNKRSNKLKIATYYIVAVGKNKLNIFFGYNDIFASFFEPKYEILRDKIKEFNDRNEIGDVNISEIISNINKNNFQIFGSDRKNIREIHKIDEPAEYTSNINELIDDEMSNYSIELQLFNPNGTITTQKNEHIQLNINEIQEKFNQSTLANYIK